MSRVSTKRASRLCATLGAALLASSCTSQPSQGPSTVTGLPSHVDGGPGQVLRFCETLHDKGDLATAAAMCERAHRLDPSRPEPLLELASILGEMGESELSLQAYRTVLRTSPDNAPAHYGLGRNYLDRGHYDQARIEFEAAVKADPKNPRLHSALGVTNGLLGNHLEAQHAFRAGLRHAPDDRALRNNLALSLVQSGRYDEGLSLLSKLAGEPGADLASRENLQMAEGLAAAARAEARRAELRAKAKAEAKARAEAAAKAEAEAMAKAAAQTEKRAAIEATQVAEISDVGAGEPRILLSYPESSWPMDGPGEPVAARTEPAQDAPPRLASERPAKAQSRCGRAPGRRAKRSP